MKVKFFLTSEAKRNGTGRMLKGCEYQNELYPIHHEHLIYVCIFKENIVKYGYRRSFSHLSERTVG